MKTVITSLQSLRKKFEVEVSIAKDKIMVEAIFDFRINIFWAMSFVRDSTSVQNEWHMEFDVFEIVC
jgi:hypothetical protein